MVDQASVATRNGQEPVVLDEDFQRLAEHTASLPPARSSSQRAFDVILHGILTGMLPSGKRLKEIPLANALGVGRTPVREALMRLETDGFVTSEPRVGMVVAGNTVESLSEIYEVNEVLDGFAAQLAARYARSSDLAAMRAVLVELAVATQRHEIDIPRLRALNSRFHELIHIAARNDQLRRQLRHLLNLIRLSPVSAYAVEGRAEESLAEHRAILDAIAAGDEARASELASDHKRRDKEARLSQMTTDTGFIS